MGLVLAVIVHAADVQDRDGARLALSCLAGRFPRLELIWADGAYAGNLVTWARNVGGWTLELVRRPRCRNAFEVIPPAGLSSAHSRGPDAAGDWARTTKNCRRPPKHGSATP